MAAQPQHLPPAQRSAAPLLCCSAPANLGGRQRRTGGGGGEMRVFILLWTFGFVLKEAQAWGFKNGIFHNSIWLGKTDIWFHLSLFDLLFVAVFFYVMEQRPDLGPKVLFS